MNAHEYQAWIEAQDRTARLVRKQLGTALPDEDPSLGGDLPADSRDAARYCREAADTLFTQQAEAVGQIRAYDKRTVLQRVARHITGHNAYDGAVAPSIEGRMDDLAPPSQTQAVGTTDTKRALRDAVTLVKIAQGLEK